jgi:ABC-type branched-subunit amino acid transport system substrate-binding protein
VDLVLGPYSSPITDAVADVTETHRLPMVAPAAPTTSIALTARRIGACLITCNVADFTAVHQFLDFNLLCW